MPNRPHDIYLKSIGGIDIGFMLRRNNNGRQYYVEDAQTIAPRLLTQEQLTQQQLPPDLALTFPQTSWERGIGGIKYVADDPNVLADATGIDITEKGMIKLAKDIAASTVDSAPNTYNPTGFAITGTQSWAFIGRDTYSWDFSNKTWDIQTEPVAADRIYRNGILFDGVVYAPSWADDIGSSGSYVNADEPVNYLHKSSSAAQWTLIDNDAAAFDGPKYMAVASQKIWGGYWTDAADSGINANEAIDTSETTIDVTPDPRTALVAGDVIRIESEFMLVTGSDATTITVIRGYRGSVGVSHSTSTDIYEITENVHQVRSSTNATSYANWSTVTSVGDAGSPITALVGIGNQLVVFKTDGIYTLEEDGTVTSRLPGGTRIGHSDFGKGAFAWNRLIIVPLHSSGCWEVDTETWNIRDISFSLSMPAQTQYHGRVVAGAGDPTTLYLIVQDTSSLKYHVMMSINPGQAGLSDYAWSAVGSTGAYVTGTDANHATAFLTAVTNGANEHHRLLVGVESTGSNLLPFHLFHDTHDVDYDYSSTGGEVYTVAFDAGFPNVLKRAQRITLNGSNLGAVGGGAHYLDVRYRVDGGSWLYVHTGTLANGSNGSSFTGGSSVTMQFSSGVTFRKIELRFTITRKSTGNQSTPSLHDFTLTCQLRTESLKLFPLSLYIANGIRLNNGMVENRARVKRDNLRTWNAQGAEIVMSDSEGVQRKCMVLPGRMKETEIYKIDRRFAEYQVDIVLADVGVESVLRTDAFPYGFPITF